MGRPEGHGARRAGGIDRHARDAAVNRRWQRDFNREWAESLQVKRPLPLGEVALDRMVRAEGFEPPTPAV